MSDLIERLSAACDGHPNAKIPWPHRLLHEAIAEIARLRAENAALSTATVEFHWMARRYCDGRMSTVVSSVNGIARDLIEAGIPLHEPRFARDGMGRSFDGLTEAEALAAQEDMPRGHAFLEAEWQKRTADLQAENAALRADNRLLAGAVRVWEPIERAGKDGGAFITFRDMIGVDIDHFDDAPPIGVGPWKFNTVAFQRIPAPPNTRRDPELAAAVRRAMGEDKP
jgi:hypothetical protein